MIHRFVDRLLERVVAPIVPLMVTIGAGTDTTEVWVIGGGSTPFRVATQPATGAGGSHISDPRLSPDESLIVYGYVPAGVPPNNGRIRVATVDGLSDTQILSGVSSFTSSVTLSPCWSPDGTQIAYVDPPNTLAGSWSLMKMNADGTGSTSLYTAGSPSAGETMRSLSWSPSGTYIACRTTKNPNGADRIHVVKQDGTGGSVVYTGPSGGAVDGSAVSAPAWQRGSDVLGFSVAPTTGNYTFRTINADGTGLATIYSDASRVYSGVEVLSWLSDDSALVALKAVSGNWQLATIDAGGGGPTDMGVALSPTASSVKLPFVMVTSMEAPRIYYMTESTGIRTISSVLEDFTDVRVDWDGSAYSSVTQHHGVFDYDVG